MGFWSISQPPTALEISQKLSLIRVNQVDVDSTRWWYAYAQAHASVCRLTLLCEPFSYSFLASLVGTLNFIVENEKTGHYCFK